MINTICEAAVSKGTTSSQYKNPDRLLDALIERGVDLSCRGGNQVFRCPLFLAVKGLGI